MLLTETEFAQKCLEVSEAKDGVIAIDFETDGLRPFTGSKATLIGFAWKDQTYSCFLDPISWEIAGALGNLVCNYNLTYCAHNAKFEMGFLFKQWGLEICGKLWDTAVMARLEYNDHRSYSLQKCAEQIGMTKLPAMLEWLKKYPAHDQIKGYLEAPRVMLSDYCEQDAKLSLRLYEHQKRQFQSKDWASDNPNFTKLIELEQETTRHLFDMEWHGIAIDLEYCTKALAYELGREREAQDEFKRLTGTDLVSSAKCLRPIFLTHRIPYGKTENGKPSFDEETLSQSKGHPIVDAILTSRRAHKRVGTYWSNYLALGRSGRIHPNIRQAGTATGRFSCADPNLQNIPTDDDESAYPVRRAFTSDPGCQIVSMDYKGMEYRLIADEAQDERVINAIKKGEDTHQEIADEAGVARSKAKNGVFARLYGAGIPRLAQTLGVDLTTAERVARVIDTRAPGIHKYARSLTRQGERSGKGTNSFGRTYQFGSSFAYKYPDYRTQGGCSDILRTAIKSCAAVLQEESRESSYLAICIHDELVFNLHRDDFDLIPKLKQAMIDAHVNKKSLEMDVSVNVGPNFHDLEEYKC